MKLKDQVQEFHQMIGVTKRATPGFESTELRLALVEEEARELRAACQRGDFPEAVDALADLAYVVEGAFLAWGVDSEPIYDEVHEANMRKAGGPKHPVTGKHLKPAGWRPPDIKARLEEQGWKAPTVMGRPVEVARFPIRLLSCSSYLKLRPELRATYAEALAHARKGLVPGHVLLDRVHLDELVRAGMLTPRDDGHLVVGWGEV